MLKATWTSVLLSILNTCTLIMIMSLLVDDTFEVVGHNMIPICHVYNTSLAHPYTEPLPLIEKNVTTNGT